MALFVDLGDDDVEPPSQHVQGEKPVWSGCGPASGCGRGGTSTKTEREEAHGSAGREDPNRNSMTAAWGCYPVIMVVASCIDHNTLDNLSRTCRQVRAGLLQYRKMLLASTLHCCNEALPVDGEETLRYRARAGNWYYMEDTSRTSYSGKSGECARDMVSECRRCGVAVCRNCVIKPPAPVVLQDRHRRLCLGCTRAPLGSLVSPAMLPDVSLASVHMQRTICTCVSEGVWLCQPCGRSIRGADYDYRGIWRWRNQYGEVLGGLGTGIGEGDRGVVCGRGQACCSAKEKEQEVDCDAEDAREAECLALASNWRGPQPSSLGASSRSHLDTPFGTPDDAGSLSSRRAPSPGGPGYDRHEIEGIGGVVKRKLVRMVRVGACVPEYEDEKAKGVILGREVTGSVRSWCGWCWRVIPGRRDCEAESASGLNGQTLLS